VELSEANHAAAALELYKQQTLSSASRLTGFIWQQT